MGIWWLAILAGCAPDLSGRPLWVVDRQADGTYEVTARELPGLSDPYHLIGDVAHGYAGGTLLTDDYHHGGPLRIDAVEVDGAYAALDEDGTVIWSFYAHLDDAVTELDGRGHDLSPIFPVDVAFTPASFMDFSAVENAAYVLGQRTFVLFPDALSAVPLAANVGVVRHELGHAWFELLASGESGGEIPWLEASTNGALGIRALNEGFADTVATLSLDDPRFIDASIPLPERDVTQDVISTGRYPELEETDLIGTLTYDPYALGTVYAAFAWDVREATDPDTALDLAVGAVQAWGEEAAWEDVDRYVLLYVTLAEGDARDAACASAAVRFPHLSPPECP